MTVLDDPAGLRSDGDGDAGPARPGVAATCREALALAGRRLRHLRRAPARVIGVTLGPLIFLVMLGYLFEGAIRPPAGGDYVAYLFPGAAVQVALAGIGPTAIAVAMDLRSGLLSRLLSLPISRSAVLLGHTAADLVVAAGSLAVVTAVGLLLGWRPDGGAAAVAAGFAVIVGFSYVMLWVGVLLAVLLRTPESISAVSPLIAVVMPFLSSAFLVPADMPAAVRPLAEWNPLSAVIALCRRLWGDAAVTGGSYPDTHPVLVLTVSLGLLLALSAAVSLRGYRRP